MDVAIATIYPIGCNFAPRAWAKCEGQLLAISSNSALFSLIGTIYGGDGRTTFALPDLRGRMPIHQGHGPGLTTRVIGSRGGQESVILNTMEMPSHNHLVKGVNQQATVASPAGGLLANFSEIDQFQIATEGYATTANTSMASDTIGHTGGNLSHENRPPYIALNFIIALYGIYPSRS